MSEDIGNDLYSTKWFRALIVSALLAGAGGGLSSLNKDTSDRYKGADAARDFRVRDIQINSHEARLAAAEGVQRTHLQHSATYTQIIVQTQKDVERLENRLRDLEQEEHNRN